MGIKKILRILAKALSNLAALKAIKKLLHRKRYSSTDYRFGGVVERVEWLAGMYECTKEERNRTEETLERFVSALKVIHTWATFENGVALDRKDVANLCRETLYGEPAAEETE